MRDLAAKCDMDYNQVYRVEKGLVNTTISMVQSFAEGLQIPPQDLFNFKFPAKTKK
jgi:transcriptional regulator with XRE-family HTH domain